MNDEEKDEYGLPTFAAELAKHLPTREQRDEAAIPQRVDQLEDAVMNLARLYEELKRTLVANNIHPPMPGHASPADE